MTGIVVASACGSCAHEIGGPQPWAPDRHMAIIGADHIAELTAAGWVLTRYPHEPPDLVCPHYHAQWAQDPGPSQPASTRHRRRGRRRHPGQ